MKMKQMQMHSFGGPDVLQLVETSIPALQAGEILIEVVAIGVNYSDILRRRNQYFQPTDLPYVLGSEAVGKIVSVAKDVTAPFTIGATVLAILPRGGGYATHVIAKAQYCVPLPPDFDAKTATAIFVQGCTAQLMLKELAGNVEGKTVLVNAAAGGVGSILVQLATMAGATVIATASTSEKLQIATQNGAALGINYSLPNWRETLMTFTEGIGVDIVFEMVGGDVYNESIASVKEGGHIIVYGCASGIQGNIHPEYFVDKSITQTGFNLAHFIQTKPAVWQSALSDIIEWLLSKKLFIHHGQDFKLTDAAEAHRQIELRQTTGKVLLST